MPGTPRPRRPGWQTDSLNPNTARLLRAPQGRVKNPYGECGACANNPCICAKAVKKRRKSAPPATFGGLLRPPTKITIARRYGDSMRRRRTGERAEEEIVRIRGALGRVVWRHGAAQGRHHTGGPAQHAEASPDVQGHAPERRLHADGVCSGGTAEVFRDEPGTGHPGDVEGASGGHRRMRGLPPRRRIDQGAASRGILPKASAPVAVCDGRNVNTVGEKESSNDCPGA